MACDTTCYGSGAIPLAYFRMLRDERRRRAEAQIESDNDAAQEARNHDAGEPQKDRAITGSAGSLINLWEAS